MAAIKRPLPYIDGKGTFKASAVMQAGDLVYMSAAETITKATTGGTNNQNYIGVALRDEKYISANGTDQYAANTPVPVEFRGKVFRSVSSAPITAGNFIRQAASGQVYACTSTTIVDASTIGIALTTVGTSEQVEWVKL